jgi:hypothetical protein
MEEEEQYTFLSILVKVSLLCCRYLPSRRNAQGIHLVSIESAGPEWRWRCRDLHGDNRTGREEERRRARRLETTWKQKTGLKCPYANHKYISRRIKNLATCTVYVWILEAVLRFPSE